MDILRLRQFKELISGWDLVPCEDFQIMRQHCFLRLEILCAHAIIWYWNLPWEKSLFCISSPVSNTKKNIYRSNVQITLSFTVISDVYSSFIPNEITFTKYCLTQWISKLLGSFEIHWVRQYLINFTGLIGLWKQQPSILSRTLPRSMHTKLALRLVWWLSI